MMQYAPDGWAWYSVATPAVFREDMLPTDATLDTKSQRAARRRLDDLAERHGTYVHRSDYRMG